MKQDELKWHEIQWKERELIEIIWNENGMKGN